MRQTLDSVINKSNRLAVLHVEPLDEAERDLVLRPAVEYEIARGGQIRHNLPSGRLPTGVCMMGRLVWRGQRKPCAH